MNLQTPDSSDVLSANTRSAWNETSSTLIDTFWTLAEARPDFEELPSWIIDGEDAINNVDPSQKPITAMAVGQAIVRSLADRYGDDKDRIGVAQWEAKFSNSDRQAASLLSDAIDQAKHFRNGLQRLPLAIHDDEVCVGKHARISFNRTLRIPEDGKAYPLPAGFGRLPILRVEDYAAKLPPKWVLEGGFIIPLYQREALFLEFSGVKWRPTIAKVSVGRVNAVSGKPHDLAIRPHRQDYVVIPDQRWLDGINSGDGAVRQFVAMPLGEGYTIEAQITDEEKHGGFQLVIYDPKAGRFNEEDPSKRTAAAVSRRERAFRAKQRDILDSFPADTRKLVTLLESHHYIQAAELAGRSGDDVLNEIRNVRSRFEELLGPSGFEGIVPGKNLEPPDLSLRAQSTVSGVQFMPSAGEAPATASLKLYSTPAVKEMGIAAGGRIKQQILDDEYGADSWDPQAYRDIVVHIVNSAVFEEITGAPPPESPITLSQYQHHKIPWYSNYDEKATTVSAAGILRRILSVGQVDKQRAVKEQVVEPARPITEEEIIRIRVPSLEDRVKALVKRAQQSLQAGRYKIAAREASLAVNLVPSHPLPLLLRAQANLRLGFHSDAEADASACLKLEPDNMGALTIRAYSSLELGEILLAKNDAELILASQPDDYDGLYVRAETNLRLAHYNDAVGDAERILRRNPANRAVLRLRKSAMTRLSEEKQVSHTPAQQGIPEGKEDQFLAVAQVMIGAGVNTPRKFSDYLEARYGEMMRPYYQALWDAIGMADDTLRGQHDWEAIRTVTDWEGSTLRTSVALRTPQRSFKTLEQQLIETDHPAWSDQTMGQPFWIAVREAAARALTKQNQSVPFFQHFITFFREAILLELPLNDGWDSEWLALIFESAFGLANAEPKYTQELLHKFASKGSCSQQIVGAFNHSALRWPAHDYVRRVVENWKSKDYQEIAGDGGGPKWLLESAESFFWAGIHAATEARQDPETLELIEFFDISNTRDWGDSRLHVNLVRNTPLRCNASIDEPFCHPLLRIAAEKYRNNSAEEKTIVKFLGKLCTEQKLKSEREDLDRDLFVCEWVHEGIHFGERLLENEPNTFAEMLQTANGYAGDGLLVFYERTLARVEDRANSLNVTRAFLEWQAEERGEVNPRYYGERLETLLNCIDAAIYLPWAEATKSK